MPPIPQARRNGITSLVVSKTTNLLFTLWWIHSKGMVAKTHHVLVFPQTNLLPASLQNDLTTVCIAYAMDYLALSLHHFVIMNGVIVITLLS